MYTITTDTAVYHADTEQQAKEIARHQWSLVTTVTLNGTTVYQIDWTRPNRIQTNPTLIYSLVQGAQ